jgi:hypothetical protein
LKQRSGQRAPVLQGCPSSEQGIVTVMPHIHHLSSRSLETTYNPIKYKAYCLQMGLQHRSFWVALISP